jgi:ankyrin repeat protein
MFEELEQKFISIETKIKLKQNSINDSFQHEIKVLDENYNEKRLFEKYSNKLNLYRDGILKQISKNMRKYQNILENKQIRDLEFKRSSVKSAKISIGKLIKKEFKLSKIFSICQLIKYKKYLGLDEVIETVDESNDINALIEAMSLASQLGRFETVKYLHANGVDVDAKGKSNDTALVEATQKGHLNIFKYLVENGADVNAKNEHNFTAIKRASFWGPQSGKK